MLAVFDSREALAFEAFGLDLRELLDEQRKNAFPHAWCERLFGPDFPVLGERVDVRPGIAQI